MLLRYRIGDYLTTTSFVWGLFLLWLIPFQIWVVKLTWTQFWDWLLIGTLAEMVFAYPLSKMIVKYCPRITLYWVNLSKKHET